MTKQKSTSLIEFPCIFPIKFIGLRQDSLIPSLIQDLQLLIPEFNEKNIEISKNSNAKYLCLTLNVCVNTKIQLDNVYQYLSKHVSVKFVM